MDTPTPQGAPSPPDPPQNAAASTLTALIQQMVGQTQQTLDAFTKHRKDFIEGGAALGQMPGGPFRRFTEEARTLYLFQTNDKFRGELRELLAKYEPAAATSKANSPAAAAPAKGGASG